MRWQVPTTEMSKGKVASKIHKATHQTRSDMVRPMIWLVIKRLVVIWFSMSRWTSHRKQNLLLEAIQLKQLPLLLIEVLCHMRVYDLHSYCCLEWWQYYDMWLGDCLSYLNAMCNKKIWFEGGLKCGEDKGKVIDCHVSTMIWKVLECLEKSTLLEILGSIRFSWKSWSRHLDSEGGTFQQLWIFAALFIFVCILLLWDTKRHYHRD